MASEERGKIRETTQREGQEEYRLKLGEKDKVIGDMRKQVEELRRKSDQGSQQLQGEVLELELEAILRRVFRICTVETGVKGTLACPTPPLSLAI
jgi:hypothetical protein